MMNNDLFYNNIDIVKRIVNKMDYGYIDKDDLYQAGLIGLYKAVQKYDISLNSNFRSYSSIYIINEIKNELRNNKLIILNKKILKVKRFLNNSNENLSINEISNKLKVDKEIIHLSLIYKNDVSSLNEVIDEEELLNKVIDNNDNKIIEYEINKLDEDSKKIIYLKYYRNYSQSEIAKILNCSQSKISRIEMRALEILKNRFK